jgi:hypothetical protein
LGSQNALSGNRVSSNPKKKKNLFIHVLDEIFLYQQYNLVGPNRWKGRVGKF